MVVAFGFFKFENDPCVSHTHHWRDLVVGLSAVLFNALDVVADAVPSLFVVSHLDRVATSGHWLPDICHRRRGAGNSAERAARGQSQKSHVGDADWSEVELCRGT